MSKSVNNVILLGRLTRDPELKNTSTGKSVVSFSLAVDKGNDSANFFEVTAWDKLAEIISEYTFKGSKVLVQGKLDQQTWDGKDGKKQSKIIVIANDLTFLDSKTDDSTRKMTQHEAYMGAKNADVVLEDIEDKPIDLSEIPF